MCLIYIQQIMQHLLILLHFYCIFSHIISDQSFLKTYFSPNYLKQYVLLVIIFSHNFNSILTYFCYILGLVKMQIKFEDSLCRSYRGGITFFQNFINLIKLIVLITFKKRQYIDLQQYSILSTYLKQRQKAKYLFLN